MAWVFKSTLLKYVGPVSFSLISFQKRIIVQTNYLIHTKQTSWIENQSFFCINIHNISKVSLKSIEISFLSKKQARQTTFLTLYNGCQVSTTNELDIVLLQESMDQEVHTFCDTKLTK